MPEDLKIHCNQCLRSTKHQQRSAFEEFLPEGETINWRIVQCNGCEGISFYKEHTVDNGNGEWEVTEYYAYPLRQYRVPKQFIDAPQNLDQVYRETIEAFNNSSLLFCAGGLRALVEGICAAQQIINGPKFNLERGEFERKRETNEIIRGESLLCKIEGLAERNILTTRTARTLHEHRYLGNKALHELDIPTKEAISVAINIIEHLMEELYNIEAQAEDLRRARQHPQE